MVKKYARKDQQKKVLGSMYRMAPHEYILISYSLLGLTRWLMKQNSDLSELTEEQVRKSLYNLEKKKFIKRLTSSGKIRLRLTKEGKQYIQKQNLDGSRYSHPSRWDGKWRFVMFDIPQKQNYAREVLRDKLKRLGFFMAQQSVWVFPYDCNEEIDNLYKFIDLRKYVLQFVATVKNDSTLKNHFRKRGFKL